MNTVIVSDIIFYYVSQTDPDTQQFYSAFECSEIIIGITLF